MSYVTHLQCVECGARYSEKDDVMLCPACVSRGKAGILDIHYDYTAISRVISRDSLAKDTRRGIWRYMPFLPVDPDAGATHLRVGDTPMYESTSLARAIGLETVYVKDDGLNPTGSLKDRASAVAVSKALERGASMIACASTGNAASSLAGNAASVGLGTCIFVPERAPQGKVAQLLIYGATVVVVEGSYKDAFDLSSQAIEKWGWYNRNAAINPYLVEGKKTVSFEIAEALNWEVPDWVVVAVGDGCTLAGVWKGFKDLKAAGLTKGLPKVAGVQAQGCAPIAEAFRQGVFEIKPWREDTLADSIAVGVPRNPRKALMSLYESGGTVATVSDEEILLAMRLIGQTTGIFAEPAASASVAGLSKLVSEGVIGPGERVVAILTGNGLKDIKNGIRAASEPIRVKPDLWELEEVLREKGFDFEGA
ncbi:MAG TPA: threonine synthase [Clostridia bacterium]|nr:threonine synthase [Clostridia bacterium]